MEKQLHDAEKQREKINKDMGNLRQDIDTQKVLTKTFLSSELMCFIWHVVVFYITFVANTKKNIISYKYYKYFRCVVH